MSQRFQSSWKKTNYFFFFGGDCETTEPPKDFVSLLVTFSGVFIAFAPILAIGFEVFLSVIVTSLCHIGGCDNRSVSPFGHYCPNGMFGIFSFCHLLPSEDMLVITPPFSRINVIFGFTSSRKSIVPEAVVPYWLLHLI